MQTAAAARNGETEEEIEEVAELVLGQDGKLKCVKKFCYLGDMLGSGGGADEASRTRVGCAWGKFNELAPLLVARGHH